MKLIGIADTTFARYDMGRSAIDELQRAGTGFRIVRYTVPGVKDLPVASKKLIEEQGEKKPARRSRAAAKSTAAKAETAEKKSTAKKSTAKKTTKSAKSTAKKAK